MNISIGKWGNSLAIRVPSALAKTLGLVEGSEVDADVKDGALVLRKKSKGSRQLDALLDGITPENLHRGDDWGDVRGREKW